VDQMMNEAQAADHLILSVYTLRRRVKDGRYRQHKIGRLKRFFRSELDEDTKKPAPERLPRRRSDRRRDEMEAFLFD
jgi:excisionase family DNA binding protein